MRLAVLADIHANLPALEAVLADLPRHGVEGLLIAGDLIAGPHPNESVSLLRQWPGWMILGNNEGYLLRMAAGDASAAWLTSRQWALMRWTYNHIDPESLAFLRTLPEQRAVQFPNLPAIRMVHGSPRHPSEEIFPDRDPALLDLALDLVPEPVLICAHTHLPWEAARDGRLAFNPGSVGAPLNGDVRAQYALLTGRAGRWQVEHRAVPYDLERIQVDFQRSGLLEQCGGLARAFLQGILTARNIPMDFLHHAYRLASQAGYPDDDIVPDAIYEQATLTFNWPQ